MKPEIIKDEETLTQISVGDLVVTTKKGSLVGCKKMVKSLLRDKEVKNYLGFCQKQKMFSQPPYIE